MIIGEQVIAGLIKLSYGHAKLQNFMVITSRETVWEALSLYDYAVMKH